MAKALLGGQALSGFDADVSVFVAGVSDQGYRLEQRGWTDASAGSGLAWDWPATALGETEWSPPGGGELLPCTPIPVPENPGLVELTLVGSADSSGAEHLVPVDVLGDDALAALETYRPGQHPGPARRPLNEPRGCAAGRPGVRVTRGQVLSAQLSGRSPPQGAGRRPFTGVVD